MSCALLPSFAALKIDDLGPEVYAVMKNKYKPQIIFIVL